MESDEDESSIVELMELAMRIQSRESEVLSIVFRFLDCDSLKNCRYLNKNLNAAATKCLQARTHVRLDVSNLSRYVQDASTMHTVWENYTIIINNRLSVDLLHQFAQQCGVYVKALELDIRYRDPALTYLEDLISEYLPNLQELTLKGKFPSAAHFPNPQRMYGRMEKVEVFNLYATNWHRLPPLPTGEVSFKSPIIGQILAAMPNVTRINYFPDVESPRDAHRHYNSFLHNLTEIEGLNLSKLQEIQHFTLSFTDIPSMEKFVTKGFPLEKLNILVEEEIQPEALCWFLETFRGTLRRLVIRSATENPIKWPRLLQLEELALIGVNVTGTDFLCHFPSLKSLHVSQDRVTPVDFAPHHSLSIPHTLTSLRIVETVAVSAAERLSDIGLAMIFRDLPYLIELAIIQHVDSTRPTFSDEGVTGSKLSITRAELSQRPRDLRILNRNLMRFSHFIGSLAELRRLTLRASNITDVSLLCGVINCHRLNFLDISSPQISEKAVIEMMDYLPVTKIRIQDFGGFTSAGKSDILVRMKFQEVFYA